MLSTRSARLCTVCSAWSGTLEGSRYSGRKALSYRCTRAKALEPSVAAIAQSPSCRSRAVFAHILLARLDPLLKEHRRPHHSGFTLCRSTLDAILALRLLAELHRDFQQPLLAAFVDLKSAFDSVDRTALWKAMKGIGVPSVLLDLVINLYTATTSRMRLGGHLSSPFTTTSGVRQGCVLAPTLFCRAMDFIMEHVSCKVGIQVH